ncbi:MAG: transcription elongation factor GreAB [Verrucomicrobia bacterium]|nr:transcription elongation factor GreAB [Verrucomicrobiota bacterium]
MDKTALAAALVAELRLRYDRAVGALSGAREAATGADTKAENKYDTRGLEASYLAAGQAGQAEELIRAIHAVEAFTFRDFDFDDPIDLGALVEIELDGEPRHYLLAPAGGGILLATEDGGEVTVLAPASPLATRLIGKSSGAILNEHEPELLVLDLF